MFSASSHQHLYVPKRALYFEIIRLYIPLASPALAPFFRKGHTLLCAYGTLVIPYGGLFDDVLRTFVLCGIILLQTTRRHHYTIPRAILAV